MKQKKQRTTSDKGASKHIKSQKPKKIPSQEPLLAMVVGDSNNRDFDRILTLQRMVGNRAVNQIIAHPSRMPIKSSYHGRPDLQRYVAHEHAKLGATETTEAGEEKQKIVTVNGVKFTYGEVMALGDFFAKPGDMHKASSKELKTLRTLIRREAKDPDSVKTEDWQKATDGRYLKLAQKNVPHFGPSRADVAPKSKGSGRNFKSEWEKHHRKALLLSQQNKKDEAMATNAFADHFLTDSFASGHIFNKEDVMALLKKALKNEDVMEKFFEKVANVAWQDSSVSKLLSKHETVEWKGIIFRPNIDSPSRFGKLLQGIYESKEGKPTLLNSAAAIVHDELNKTGIEVENAKGDKWHLSGDLSLNAKSLEIGRQAVAQSQANISSVAGKTGDLDFDKLFKAVWSYTPMPTAKSTKAMHETIKILTDPSKLEAITAAAMIIKNEIKALVKELVDRKILKLA